MKIEEAKICLDCDEIYEGSSLCPNCSGRIGWPLREWIGSMGRRAEEMELTRSTADLLFSEGAGKGRTDPAVFFHRA